MTSVLRAAAVPQDQIIGVLNYAIEVGIDDRMYSPSTTEVDTTEITFTGDDDAIGKVEALLTKGDVDHTLEQL